MLGGLMPGEHDPLYEAILRSRSPVSRGFGGGLLSGGAGGGGLLGGITEKLMTPTAQLGAMIMANSGGRGAGIGQAVAGFGQQRQAAEQQQLQQELMRAQIEAMQRPQRGGAPQTVIGPDGKPILTSDWEGKQPFMAPQGRSSAPSEVEIAQVLNDPNTPETVKRDLRNLLARKYPGPSAQEPLVAVQTPNGPVFVPRSQAAGQAPAASRENVTEGERNAAFLTSRLDNSLRTLTEIGANNRGALKPSVTASVAGSLPGVGDVARNVANSPDRQRVEAAELDFLDAALTLGTGAAYTREQLESYRGSYFPRIGDSDATVKEKEQRREALAAAARAKSGRAGGQAAPGSRGFVDRMVPQAGPANDPLGILK